MKIEASCFITSAYGRDYREITIHEKEIEEFIKTRFREEYDGKISRVSIDSIKL